MSNKRTFTKKEIVSAIAEDLKLSPQTVRDVVQHFLDKLTHILVQRDRLEFRDFGVFEVVLRKAKIGRNPKNADVAIKIPARYAVKFTPGKRMRQLVEDGEETTGSMSASSSQTPGGFGNY